MVVEDADEKSIASVKSTYEMHLNAADAKTQELYKEALERQEYIYKSRISQMNDAKSIADYERCRNLFQSMRGYKDTRALADECQAKIDKLKEEELQESEKREAARKEARARSARKKKILKVVVAMGIVAIIAAYFVVTKVVIPNHNYNKFLHYMNAKDYIAAYEFLDDLNEYEELKKSIEDEYELAKMAVAEVGDIVSFGNYNGNTEWLVLAKQEGKVLVISKNAINTMCYNEELVAVTWETCTLRRWLNETYLSSAFSKKEQAIIIESTIRNDDNAKYGTDGGIILPIKYSFFQ